MKKKKQKKTTTNHPSLRQILSSLEHANNEGYTSYMSEANYS